MYVSLVRCANGSITTDLGLEFNNTIRERDVIDTIRNAAPNGMLGEVEVDVSSIKGTRPVNEKPTHVATTTPSSPSDSKFLCVTVGNFNGYEIFLNVLETIFCIQYQIETNVHKLQVQALALSVCVPGFFFSSSGLRRPRIVRRGHAVNLSNLMYQSFQYLLSSSRGDSQVITDVKHLSHFSAGHVEL